MVRPPAMIPYLQKAHDRAAFEACLTDSVIEAVRLQADAGIDAVSDGEYGKSGHVGLLRAPAAQGHRMASIHESRGKGPNDRGDQWPRPRGLP
jgi:hypothetical protein